MSINQEKVQMTNTQTIIAGAVAGFVTRAVAQPLDVVKVRFQLQLESTKGGQAKYTSMMQSVRLISKEEGFKTLWSGHLSAQVLSITYSLVQFGTFEFLFQQSNKLFPEICLNHHFCVNFMDGALAACTATIASFPFDTARTRLIAEAKTKPVYKTLTNALVLITRQEGFFALYQGLLPATSMSIPQSGLQFAVYKAVLEYWPKLFNNNKTDGLEDNNYTPTARTLTFLLAGSFSGLVAKVTTYPFDLAKKRLQIQGFQKHRSSFGRQIYCHGLLHCLQKTVSDEGYKGLYKGIIPAIYKAIVSTAVQFTIYEEMKIFFIMLNKKSEYAQKPK